MTTNGPSDIRILLDDAISEYISDTGDAPHYREHLLDLLESTLQAEPQDRFLGIGQVARMFGVSPTAIHKWERSGRIPAAQRMAVTGHRFWKATDVEKFAEAKTSRSNRPDRAALAKEDQHDAVQ